jgi:hypothetical protein
MHSFSISNKNVNKILIYTIILSSILWPILQIFIFLIFNLDLNASFYSSLPIFFISIFIVINIERFYILIYENKIITLNIIYLMFIFVITYVQSNIEFSVKALKTCGVISIYYIFVGIAKRQLLSELIKINKFVFILISIVAFSYFFEMIFRIFNQSLYGIYDLASDAGFSGIYYLKYNDIEKFFLGSKPLGIYFDMHTGPGLILISAIYFYLLKNYNFVFLLLITLLLTYSVSTIILGLPLFLIFLKNKRNFFILISIIIVFIVEHVSLKENSLNQLKYDIINGLYLIINGNLIEIFFGDGYDPQGSARIGGNESFLIYQLAFFGVFGFLFANYVAIMNLKFKNKNQFLIKFYILFLLITLTLHYNNLFNVSSGLILSLIFLKLSNNQSNSDSNSEKL